MKYMNLTEMKTSGLLQEVNRQFFNPLGLALHLKVNDEGEVIGIQGIADMREESQGILLNNIGDDHRKRALNIISEQKRRGALRQTLLGFVVQPIPGVEDE